MSDGGHVATAGFRNAEWTMQGLPDGTSVVVQPLRTLDKAATTGLLYARGRPKTAVCIMHPREFLATHYLVPAILDAGCAAFTQTPRSVGNDLRLEHEIALLDVAAGMAWLRKQGFEKIVLLGNSGGASLYSFYNQQALLAPERRLERTPAGRPTRLAEAEMPIVDGLIFVSPHPGQGRLLLNCIDPSVTDEGDSQSIDASLDFLAPENGFRDPPESSAYAPDFIERYRAAQRARVERLDGLARHLLAEKRRARKAAGGGDRMAARRGAFSPIMTVWRTDGDLRCWDLSLDPSDRCYGSVWGRDPLRSNYGSVGFGRLCTPESWLSTWSALSSRAVTAETAKAIEQPVLFIEYSGDNTVFPADLEPIFSAIGATDKTRARFRGNHHGLALAEGETPGRVAAGELIGEWLRARCPV